MGEHNDRLDRGLAAFPGSEHIVELATDRGRQVRDAGARKRHSQRVAARPGEAVALVAPELHGLTRDAGRLGRKARDCAGAFRLGQRLPRSFAIGARSEPEEKCREPGTHEPPERAAPSRGLANGWRDVSVAVLVLDDRPKAEIGVLRSRRNLAPGSPERLAPGDQHELELGGEEHDEGQPEGYPRAERLDEEPADDEAEQKRAQHDLHPRPIGGAGIRHKRVVDTAVAHRSGGRACRVGSAAVAATMMDGRALAERIRGEVAVEVAELGHVGLATILVGDDPASDVYITSKHRVATEAGIDARDVRLPAETSEDDVLALVHELNEDDAVDGILVQLPLPAHMDETRVTYAVAPQKDVDGFHPVNAGNLYLGTPLHVPATPAGCMELLDAYDVDPRGAAAVVVGRSEIVGRPVAMLLLQAHATVTICHSRTADLAAETLRADILVAAVGVPGIVTPEMVKPGATVLDVGLTRTDEGIRGDVDRSVADVARRLTPMPGGTGPMTIAMLLRSAVKAARYRRGLLAYPTQ